MQSLEAVVRSLDVILSAVGIKQMESNMARVFPGVVHPGGMKKDWGKDGDEEDVVGSGVCFSLTVSVIDLILTQYTVEYPVSASHWSYKGITWKVCP